MSLLYDAGETGGLVLDAFISMLSPRIQFIIFIFRVEISCGSIRVQMHAYSIAYFIKCNQFQIFCPTPTVDTLEHMATKIHHLSLEIIKYWSQNQKWKQTFSTHSIPFTVLIRNVKYYLDHHLNTGHTSPKGRNVLMVIFFFSIWIKTYCAFWVRTVRYAICDKCFMSDNLWIMRFDQFINKCLSVRHSMDVESIK